MGSSADTNMDEVLRGRNLALQQLATGASLERVHTTLTRSVERVFPEVRCSLLILDEKGRLRHAAAPRLPMSYVQAIDGLEIGPTVGSCGAAAFLGERVTVEDVMTHRNWEPFRELARATGFRACWSEPVFSSEGKILGTFAMYYDSPRQPNEQELEFMKGTAQLAGIAIDRTRAEEARRENEQRYRDLFEQAPLSIWQEDFTATGQWMDELRSAGVRDLSVYLREHPEGIEHAAGLIRIVDVNKGTLTMFEAESREALLTTPPENEADATGHNYSNGTFVDQLLAIWNGQSRFKTEFCATTLRGNKRECLLQWVAPPRTGGGLDLSNVIVVISDITERKQAEEERERLSVAIDQTAETVLVTDAEGRIQYVNPAFEQISGYMRAEVVGETPRILKSGEHDEAFYKEMWDTLSRGDAWRGRLVNKNKDGTLYTAEASISPVKTASGETVSYVAVQRDITEELKLEEQFRQAQKMESVGRLAGGVAHDFNNMLCVILANAVLAMERVDSDHELKTRLADIHRAAERSADLTRQLLAFARKQIIVPRVVDLNETVARMVKMLRRVIFEGIVLDWLPGSPGSLVKVDPSQIDQVLTNLCVNARDAIEDVGKVSIETRNVTLDEADCADRPGFVPGEYVVLAVSDNGCGMNKETLDRLYEPFFTTKASGEGTGLGLAVVYGIVKQNGGFIDVCSERSRGTTFKIYLPRHVAKSTQRQEEEPAQSTEHGHEFILLVEDEPALLDITTAMLERLGYTVIAASRPGEAIRLAETHPGEIHLLLTDVVMPEMNGRDLAKNILSFYPNLKRLFTSGYTADVIAHHGVLAEGVQFLQKPFTLEDLAGKVREVLRSE
jgi:PAS domain S-box-containing protein